MSQAPGTLLSIALCLIACARAASAESGAPASPPAADKQASAIGCLPDGSGFFRAKLWGAIRAELSWNNADLECSGASRPAGGIRMRFSRAFSDPASDAAGGRSQRLAFVFGIAGLREGLPGKDLPVNITVIREGAGQFFGTQGDAKCRIDSAQQEAIAGIPRRNRSYRVVARGFCTQPAHEVRGEAVLHITRFDFAGRVDFSAEDDAPDQPTLARK